MCTLGPCYVQFYWLNIAVPHMLDGDQWGIPQLPLSGVQPVTSRQCVSLWWSHSLEDRRSVLDYILPCRCISRWNSSDDLWRAAGRQRLREQCFLRPRQTHTKLGYSQNAKGLSQTNKCNHGPPPLQVGLIPRDDRGLSSLHASLRQTQM